MNHSPDLPIPDARTVRRGNLNRLLKARSLVFIGGSAMRGGVAYCREMGFDGDVWVVNPTYDEIGGVDCVPSLQDLPATPDAAFLAVNTERAIAVTAELAAMGVPATVCYTAGFAEVDEGRLQADLIEAAGDTMAVVGPNCIGIVNYFDRVPVAIGNHGIEQAERGIAVIAQSGTITINIVGSDRSLPIGYLLSIGNQAVMDMADYIDVVADDPRVSAIVLYVEAITDVRAFAAAAAKAFHKGIPIVALKAGMSETGRRIALSHTGSMAGAPELYRALFDRLGIISVASFSELLEAVKILAMDAEPAGNRLTIETCSGTDSGYCADLAERYGIDLPQPEGAVKEALRAVIPPIATPMNPVDVTMVQWTDREAQATSLLTLLQQPSDAAALIINFPRAVWKDTYMPAINAMIDVKAKTSLPCFVISNLAEGLPQDVREHLIADGVVPLQGIEDGLAAFGRIANHVPRWNALREHGGPDARLLDGPPDGGAMTAHDEWASKAWLKNAGIETPDGRFVADARAAAAAAADIGFPVALKAAGSTLQHKSDVGAVALGLADSATVANVAQAMADDVPGVEGFLVESMVGDAVVELIVGLRRDPLFGMSLLIGAGGIFTELMRDVGHLLLPVSRQDIRAAIEGLKIAPLLHGFRGRPPGDINALVESILGLVSHVEAHGQHVLELDINPLLVRAAGHGVVAVDALLITQDPEP